MFRLFSNCHLIFPLLLSQLAFTLPAHSLNQKEKKDIILLHSTSVFNRNVSILAHIEKDKCAAENESSYAQVSLESSYVSEMMLIIAADITVKQVSPSI